MKWILKFTFEVGMKKSLPIIIGIASVFSVVGYAIIILYLTWPISKFSVANAGVFGDSFGVLTSFFSALAFVGVIWTLVNQREELKLQREEWESQKNELSDNKKELMKQGFENSFFQMLKLQNDILSGITITKSGVNGTEKFEGRDAIKELAGKLTQSFSSSIHAPDHSKLALDLAYERFYLRDGYRLAHYFRFLYNIFRFISEAGIENKDLYVRLARAQISNQELYLLFYNSLVERGEKFKKYLIDFKLMDNLVDNELFFASHKNYIPNSGVVSTTD
jgi:hypothetical protein